MNKVCANCACFKYKNELNTFITPTIVKGICKKEDNEVDVYTIDTCEEWKAIGKE